jgi:hypothetical protein
MSHDFAKAFFGEEPIICSSCGIHHDHFSDCDAGFGEELKQWQYHLQQMVLEEDPIKYLEKFI